MKSEQKTVAIGAASGVILMSVTVWILARIQPTPVVTCEYNIDPPNEPSRLFHDKFGFKERGTQWVANGTKRVSLQAAET